MEKKFNPNGVPKISPEGGQVKGGQIKPSKPSIDKTFVVKPPILRPKK